MSQNPKADPTASHSETIRMAPTRLLGFLP